MSLLDPAQMRQYQFSDLGGRLAERGHAQFRARGRLIGATDAGKIKQYCIVMTAKIDKLRARSQRGPLTKTSIKKLLGESQHHYKDNAAHEQGFQGSGLARSWYADYVVDVIKHPSKQERKTKDPKDTASDGEESAAISVAAAAINA